MEDCCQQCRFSHWNGNTLYCRRNPPTAMRAGWLKFLRIPRVLGFVPPVQKDFWCGEYQPVVTAQTALPQSSLATLSGVLPPDGQYREFPVYDPHSGAVAPFHQSEPLWKTQRRLWPAELRLSEQNSDQSFLA